MTGALIDTIYPEWKVRVVETGGRFTLILAYRGEEIESVTLTADAADLLAGALRLERPKVV